MGVSLIHEACQGLMTARYIRALDLFAHLRRAYTPRARGEAGQSDADLVDPFFKYDLLVIDECHQRGESIFEQNTLPNLLDHRYSDNRCTILIANLSKEEFAKSVGDSVVSRIHERGEALLCDWPSFRKPGSWRTPRPVRRVPSGAERRAEWAPSGR
jgi:DNA replication protein DnaC